MNKLQEEIADIIKNVRKSGDEAIHRHTKDFDHIDISPENFWVRINEIKGILNKRLSTAIKKAARNIETFHKQELKNCFRDWSFSAKGIKLGQVYRAIKKVGIYVPGGKYNYFSTLLMAAIPARIAGVEEIIIVTPPKNISPELLFAAKTAKVNKIYRVGGPMAIAALAYGTKTIPKVDLIVGPGNAFVTEAKRQVYGDVGIDMLAGPSEVVILCDKSANAEFIFNDLMAQAEHDKNAKAHLLSDDKKLLDKVNGLIPNSFKNQILLFNGSLGELVKKANEIAPEHLEIIHSREKNILNKIKNAGAIFLGGYSPVVVGDYFAGPSHILPTNKTAKFSSGLSVGTFLKRSSIINYSKKELLKSANFIEKMAESEGLSYHAKSIKIRKHK